MAERRSQERRPGAPALEVRGLNVFYGASHALQGVDLTLQSGALSVVGRNGMGKTTLCNAIMGLVPSVSGSIRFAGQELRGRPPAEIARLGIGYVPQGRRLWRSLTVEEHLRMVSAGHSGGWSIERIYSTFPRLGGATQQWRRPALGRRTADAHDRPGPAPQSTPPGHG